MKPLPRLAIVVPCYNEQEALPFTAEALLALLDRMSAEELVAPDSYVLCCNDGSRDLTWDTICRLHQSDSRIKGVSLAHNRGHQYALLAGLMAAAGQCDISVSIDADLQDDPEAIVSMVKLYHQGYNIVYGVRQSRETDTWFKRSTARAFYKMQHRMGLETIYDHADFRLMDSKALEMLSHYGESNLFLRGIIPQIGLKWTTVAYNRNKRVAGESKYPLSKMLSFSIDGITSFSARPIRLIFLFGLLLLILDLVMVAYVLVSYFMGFVIAGWSSLILSVWFLGSVILMAIGIVGEYIGKIFAEVKGRPRFEISETLF